jgi:hypothetical protein
VNRDGADRATLPTAAEQTRELIVTLVLLCIVLVFGVVIRGWLGAVVSGLATFVVLVRFVRIWRRALSLRRQASLDAE